MPNEIPRNRDQENIPRNADQTKREEHERGDDLPRREGDIKREQKDEERARREAQERNEGDDFDRDLDRDNRAGREPSSMNELREDLRAGARGDDQPHAELIEGHRQHARQGQAQSPRELNHNEPPKKKEGHR